MAAKARETYEYMLNQNYILCKLETRIHTTRVSLKSESSHICILNTHEWSLPIPILLTLYIIDIITKWQLVS